MDSNNPGQRVIPCVPEVGYYSTRGIPNFVVSVEEKQQIYGIVALGSGNFVRIDKDYNEVPFIVESTNLYTSIKTVTCSPLGTFSEFRHGYDRYLNKGEKHVNKRRKSRDRQGIPAIPG